MWRLLEAYKNTYARSRTKLAGSNVTGGTVAVFPALKLVFSRYSFTISGAGQCPLTTMSREVRSGLDPWDRADLPVPPAPQGFRWFKAVGPGVIVLGISVGSGKFPLGPAVFVLRGLSLLWWSGSPSRSRRSFNTS